MIDSSGPGIQSTLVLTSLIPSQPSLTVNFIHNCNLSLLILLTLNVELSLQFEAKLVSP